MNATYSEMANKMKQILDETNAEEAHITGVEKAEDYTGYTIVMSGYKGIKPAHIVLDELYSWAEKNNEEVKELIEKLQRAE